MSKIKSLTAEQEKMMPIYRDKWLNIGLSTDPIDLEKIKNAFNNLYVSAGLEKPTYFYVAKSPIDAINLIQKLDSKLSKQTILNNMRFGNHDAGYFSFYNFFQEVLNLNFDPKLNYMLDIVQNCGWFNLFKDVVVVQKRPQYIKFDDQNRLHCENGPSILYNDGFEIFSWHGVRIPKEWIKNKGELSPKTALKWDNIEQRRAACEIIGWARILRELNSNVIDCDEDPMIGTLIEVDIPDVGKEKFLKVLCGTGREFAIPVPPNMNSALEAQAWTWNLSIKDFGFGPEIRT